MISRRQFCAITAAAAVTGCAQSGLVDGKRVTMVVVHKERRMLYLLNKSDVLRAFRVELGFAPRGHKRFEGDGKTPEGMYRINRRNPRSKFHLSLGISYPDRNDYAYAAARGKSPGGDIFIHGTPRRHIGNRDWTAGCIAVPNSVMDLLFRVVPNGTPIHITP